MTNTTKNSTTKNSTTKNSTTKKVAKVDFFKADRKLAERTAELFRCVIAKAEINQTYAKAIEHCEEQIQTRRDMIDEKDFAVSSEVELKASIAEYVEVQNALRAERDNLTAEVAKFEWTKADRDFSKAVRNATSVDNLKTAVRAWFKVYGLTIANTTFEKDVIATIGKRVDLKTIVTSDGTKALKWDATNARKNMYACSFEAMVQAGTIGKAYIPSLLQEKYAKKSKKN